MMPTVNMLKLLPHEGVSLQIFSGDELWQQNSSQIWLILLTKFHALHNFMVVDSYYSLSDSDRNSHSDMDSLCVQDVNLAPAHVHHFGGLNNFRTYK